MFELFNINKNEDSKYYYNDVERLLYAVFNNGKKLCNLYSCSAAIWEYNGIFALVSYVTPIAVYTPYDGALYDCLRAVYGYTATSAQHISKFKKWLAENNYLVKHSVRFTN